MSGSWLVGPQREIFPGDAKVDTAPPNLFGHQTCAKFFILIFSPKLGEEQKKGLHWNLVPFFAQN